MKMTMHIDEAILEEVMDTYGYETKTDAVNSALNEMVRRHKLREFGKHGLGVSKEELKDCLFPGYDPTALRVAEPTSKLTLNLGQLIYNMKECGRHFSRAVKLANQNCSMIICQFTDGSRLFWRALVMRMSRGVYAEKQRSVEKQFHQHRYVT